MTAAHEQTGRGLRARLLMASAGLVAAVGAGVLVVGLGGQPAAPPAAPLVAASDPAAATATAAAAAAATLPTRSPAAVTLSLPASRPVSVTIATIGVRSVVQELGLTSAGALAVPAPGPLYDEVGWYRASPTPGEIGPSVLAGHVDSATTGPSVFWKLGSLRTGARIDVRRADGTTATFTVTAVARYEKTRFPTDQVYRNTTVAALRLITCGGPIDSTTGHYRDNVVVFAELTGVRRA